MIASTGIYFVVYGRAKCKWPKEKKRIVEGGYLETYNVYYEGKNVYISNKVLLSGSQGGEPIELTSYSHRYNFHFPLPPLIPASFEGPWGNIRYQIEAEIDEFWGVDRGSILQFTVARRDELNSQPELKIPIEMEEVTTFCCWCCESKPLLMTATLPFGGFVNGQDISIKVSYVNYSNTDVLETKFSLSRKIKYKRRV